MPKISVIVPIYGVEKYLKEAVDSILNQTLTDIEILLIDDGGKDACPKMIDEYAKKDNRIVAIHKANGGYGQTMNVGLKKATGEYIAILEPDDYIDSRMYEDLYNIAVKFDSDIVKSGFYDNLQVKGKSSITKVVWNDYIPEDKSFKIKEYPYFLYYHPSVWTCIYKRSFLLDNGIKFIEAPGAGWTDNPFQVQTMCLANKINYTSKAYYYWRRLNYYASDDLKDYRIPFLRTDEIHRWLQDVNINDENILLNLFRREIGYAGIVLGMKNISDTKNCYKCLKILLSRCPKTFLEAEEVRADEKILYISIKRHPLLKRLNIRISRFRKDIISIRWNSREKFVKILGNIVLARDVQMKK